MTREEAARMHYTHVDTLDEALSIKGLYYDYDMEAVRGEDDPSTNEQIHRLKERALKVLAQLDDEVIDFDMLSHTAEGPVVKLTINTLSCRDTLNEVFDVLREYREYQKPQPVAISSRPARRYRALRQSLTKPIYVLCKMRGGGLCVMN